tara:strand:+ start:740 stop:1453 length:714 start_codon:yes stop_codon:yes gene_type:complete
MNKSILILGSGRSGTSFLSNLLSANGVKSGECTSGTMENLKVRQINESYLSKYFQGQTRSKTPYGILPDEEIVVDSEFQEHSKNFVSEMNGSQSQWWDNSTSWWMMKDPRTTLLHDMWVKHFDVVIGVFRNPTEVVNSYMKLLDVYFPDDKQEGYDIMLNYWKRFNQSLLHVFETSDKEKYLFDFNDDVEKQTKTLFSNLEIDLTNFTYDKNKKHQNSIDVIDIEVYNKLKDIRNLI